MLHRKTLAFLTILLSVIVIFSFTHNAKATVADVSISPSDNVVNNDSAYDFTFTTDVATKSKTITLNFPSGYEINNGDLGGFNYGDEDNSHIDSMTDVICSDSCGWDGFISVGSGEDESLLPVASVVQVTTRSVRISLDSSYDLSGGPVSFRIKSGYIRNPNSSGTYNITVKTAKDTTPVGGDVEIVGNHDFGNFEDYGSINLSVDDDSITADDTATFTVHAFDQYENDIGDVSGDATFDISDEDVGGSFDGNQYSPGRVGEWEVTAHYGGHSASVWITVDHGTATSLNIECNSDSYNPVTWCLNDYVYPGGSNHYYSIYRDHSGNFVSNGAVTWSLQNKTGILDADLVVDEDGKGAEFTGDHVGSADIQVESDGFDSDTTGIDVHAYSVHDSEHFGHITVTPGGDSINADQTKTFSVEAYDNHDNDLGDVTSSTSFTIDEDAGGYFDDGTGVYHAEKAGDWTVEGNYNGFTNTAGLTVNPGSFDHITISPRDTTITADQIQIFSAESFDVHDNSLGDVTGDTTFSVMGIATPPAPQGSFTGATYHPHATGTFEVTGTDGELSDTTDITVTPGALDHIIMTPNTDTISADYNEDMTVEAYDYNENLIGDVTGDTDFSVTGENSGNAAFSLNSFYSEHPDEYTVRADYGGKNDTSGITVTVGQLDHFTVSGITDPIVAGASSSVTVTAKDQYGNTITDYTGTALFSSSDDNAILPAGGEYAFQEGDNGTVTLGGEDALVFETAGEQSVTACDSYLIDVCGSQAGITVRHAGIDHFTVHPSKTSLAMNENFSLTITALDLYGNTINNANGATAYTGTVTIETNATSPFTLPSTATFTGTSGIKSLSALSFTVEEDDINISVADGEVVGESADMEVSGDLPMPDTNVEPGIYYSTQHVTFSADDSISIHYTTNGMTPTCSNGSTTFPITVSSTTIINTLACYSGGVSSGIISYTYTIREAGAPIASPVASTYHSTQFVTLSASTGSTSMRYTIGSDPATPTCSSGTVYSDPISVSSTSTIKAIACYPGPVSSSVATFAYTITILHSSVGGGGGGGSVPPVVIIPPVTPTTPAVTPPGCQPGYSFSSSTGAPCPKNTTTPSSDSSLDAGLCSASQILTQNLRAPARNGVYNSYTGAIVFEVKILQGHMNRLGFNSGPEDGILGSLTDGAIRRMQAFLGTFQDGMVGPITRGLINHSCGTAGLQS